MRSQLISTSTKLATFQPPARSRKRLTDAFEVIVALTLHHFLGIMFQVESEELSLAVQPHSAVTS